MGPFIPENTETLCFSKAFFGKSKINAKVESNEGRYVHWSNTTLILRAGHDPAIKQCNADIVCETLVTCHKTSRVACILLGMTLQRNLVNKTSEKFEAHQTSHWNCWAWPCIRSIQRELASITHVEKRHVPYDPAIPISTETWSNYSLHRAVVECLMFSCTSCSCRARTVHFWCLSPSTDSAKLSDRLSPRS